jgi:hypothetical protein
MPNGNTARQILEQPFDPALIKTRPASYGGSLSYVEGCEYIKRLNAALDGAWSFEITAHQVTDNECIVIGKLTADGIVKMAFGGSDIKRKKETGEVICLADDLKAAATDALKKAASLLGVGLHLYGDSTAANSTTSANANNATAANDNDNGDAKPPSNGNGNGQSTSTNGNGEDKSRLSSKQLGMILGLARERNISRDKLQVMVHERYSRKLEFITRSEASFFIGELQAA